MEVTCDRCHAEYEFEEALVADGGTTVKCTNCGHLFKIRVNPSDAPEGAADDAHDRARWTVRAPDDSELYMASLEELVRRIAAGHLSEDHSISHGGRSWKRLGDVDELSGFFRRGERLRKASMPPVSRPPTHTAAGPPRESTPPPAPPSSPPSTFVDSAPVGRLAESPPPTTASHPVVVGAIDPPLPDGATGTSLALRPPSPLDSTPVGYPEEAEDEHSDPLPEPLLTGPTYADLTRARRRRTAALLFLVCSVAALAAVNWWPSRPPPASTPIEVGPEKFLEEADRALSAYQPEMFEQAATQFTKALAFHERDPHLLSALSRTYARWSEQLRIELDLADAELLARVPEQRERLRRESEDLTRQARRAAETATRKNPGNSEAEIALADALRLSGNLVAARAELDRARATETSAAAETLRVAAHLAIAEAQGNPKAGRDLARQAVAQEPDELVYRVLLTALLIHTGKLDTAEYHIRALNKQAPGHPMTGMLEDAFGASRKQAQTPPAPPPKDAGTPSAAATTATPEGRDPTASEEPPPPEKPATTSKVPAVKDNRARVIDLVRNAERLLLRGMATRAEQALKEALRLDPASSRAQTGLGYVYLERGRVRQAQVLFRKATRRGYPEAFIGLGAALRELDRNRAALNAYKTYMRRFPKGRSASIATRQIRLLEERIREKKEKP